MIVLLIAAVLAIFTIAFIAIAVKQKNSTGKAPVFPMILAFVFAIAF